MISFAKKILAPGRATTAQPLGSDAKVRKYSLTSAYEQPAPVSGTSFTLNPEHLFSSAHPFARVGVTNGVDVTTNAPNMEASEGSSRQGSPREGARNGSVENLTVVKSSGAIATGPLATSAIATSSIATGGPMATVVIAIVNMTTNEPSQCRDSDPRIQSDDRTSDPHTPDNTSRGSSISDDPLGSMATLSDAPVDSTSSLNIMEPSARFLRARRKQREPKPRRKTLDVFYLGVDSSDQNSSKSLTPSPDPGRVDPRSGSWSRRHTVGGTIDGSDVVSSPVDEVLGFRGGPWSGTYASSDDLVSEVSGVEQRRKAVSAEGMRRVMGMRRRSFAATTFCVSEMKRCLVIADLDLLEEDTEFEPCTVPFENAVVLWPAAADKPSCFESSGVFRSCITSLEAIGFVGSECLLVAPVTLSQGLHEQTQLLFLFPHHLLFAKQKSHSLLKLDQKVSASDIWLSTRKEDIADIMEMDSSLDGSRSFVLGWPMTTNSVVTFCTSEEKAAWVAKIEELIEAESARDKNPDRQLTIKVVQKERGHTRTRELSVARSEKSSLVLQRCLTDFHLEASSSKDFQLFVRWGKDQPLQPLLGHESPFLFETWFQTLAQRKDNSHGCCFVLRERKRTKLGARDTVGRRRLRMFKRSQTRTAKSGPPLFGSRLDEICVDNTIPRHILTLLRYLYEHGPGTDGVFRKAGGHKEVSDFKEHVSSAEEVNFDDVSIHVVAAVVKEWLRRLPDCLLSSDLFLQWMEVPKISDPDLLHKELRRLSSSLPSSHLLVLRHVMCVLHRIQLHSKQNRMTPFNLAVCIAPNILRPTSTATLDLQLTSVAIANAVVGMMINAIEPVLGSDCIDLYSDVADPRVIQEFEVDGAYEQNLSLDHHNSFAPNSTGHSMESLNSLHDSPPLPESSTILERMSQDSGLAASTLQLSEEDPLTSAPQPENHYLKRARQTRERSEVSDSQTALDSDSLGSEKSESAPVQLRMRGARNVRERVHRLRAMKVSLEELASSFEEQYSFSDDRSDSVVIIGEDLRSEDEKLGEKIGVSTLAVIDKGTKVGDENDREDKATLSSTAEEKDNAKVEIGETLGSNPTVSNLLEIVASETTPKKPDITTPSICIIPETPISPIAINWVETPVGVRLGDTSPRKQPPHAPLILETGHPSSDLLISPTLEIIAHKPQKNTIQASKKVEQPGTLSVAIPLGASLESRERDKPGSNPSQKDRGKNDTSESILPSKRLDHVDSGAVSQEIARIRANAHGSKETMTASKEMDLLVDLPRSDGFVGARSSPRGKITNGEFRGEPREDGNSRAGLVDPRVDDQSLITARSNDHRRDNGSRDVYGKGWVNNRVGEARPVDGEPRLKDQPKELRLKVQLTDFRLIDQPRDNRVKDQLMDSRLKHQPKERRLKDQPRDSRLKDQPRDIWLKDEPRDSRLKNQPRDSRLKDQPRDSWLKDQPRDSRLKVQQRDSWLKDQPRDSRLKDQPRDSRLKVQPRDIDDNWRLTNRVPADSERVERGTSARVVTSAYVGHITSEGCRVTMGTPTGHSPRYLPQNGEPPRSREPIRRTERHGPPRSVTVIQLCDEDSVIVQKNVRTT